MKTARIILISFILLIIGAVIFGLVTKKGLFNKKQIPFQATPNPYDLGIKKVNVAKNLTIQEAKEVIQANATFMEPASLAAKFNFQGNPDKNNPNLWKWSGDKGTLVYNFPTKSFDFKDENTQAKEDLKDQGEGEKIAQDFIKTKGLLGKDFTVKIRETSLLKGEEQNGLTTSFKDAKYVIVSFDVLFQGKPVFLESNRSAFLSVWVNKKGSIFSLSGSLPVQLDKVVAVTIKTEQEALKQVGNREGVVISVIQTEAPKRGQPEDYSYQEANFTSGYLGYNTLGNKMVPIYVFTGVAKNNQGKNLQITAFIHALTKLP